jgi:uncharacterized protein YkwD
MRPHRVLRVVAVAVIPFLLGAPCHQSQPAVYNTGPGGAGNSGSSLSVTPAGPVVSWSANSSPPNGTWQQILSMINAQRNAQGMSSLVWHDGLAAEAQYHSSDMLKQNYLSLVAPQGYDVFQQLVNASPAISFTNVFAIVFEYDVSQNGGNQALNVFNALMGNSSSKAALMTPAMTHFGGNGHGPPYANNLNHETVFVGQNVAP